MKRLFSAFLWLVIFWSALTFIEVIVLAVLLPAFINEIGAPQLLHWNVIFLQAHANVLTILRFSTILIAVILAWVGTWLNLLPQVLWRADFFSLLYSRD